MSRRLPSRTTTATFIAALLLVCSVCFAEEVVVFSENFDDGDWTSSPAWETAPADPSVTISSDRCVSPPYSLKIAAANNMGAIRTASGLTSADKPFTCTFNLYVESIPEEAIPWCLQRSNNAIVAIVFLLSNGRVQLANIDSSGAWVRSNVAYPLSYGQWHTFRITYDGTTENLYIDGHETPDASITMQYVGAPTKLCIGNFSMAHTGTIYVDDIVISAEPPPPPPPPGRVYVQFCSDTSTDGLGTNNHYNNFPEDDYSYTSPTGQAAQVFAESFRDAHRDSLGNPIKLTWYMNCGSMYACGTDTGPLLPFDLMMDYHGADVARCGDEMAYHYHTWIWNGSAWVQAAEFTESQADYESTVAHLVIDRGFYPTSFRSGWNWMSNYWENYLDDWIIYRFEGASGNGWVPYHPSPTDWRSPGSQRGWEASYTYTPSLSQSLVNSVFAGALGGTDQVMTCYSHLKETDFADKIHAAHQLFVAAHAAYPTVEFEYLTGRECMARWRGLSSAIPPPEINVSTSDAGGVRTAIISTNTDIYQRQPFIAVKTTDGTYSRIDAAPAGTNRWAVNYNLSNTAAVAAAVTDWYGNSAVKELPVPLAISDVAVSVTSTSAQVNWQTNIPADTRLDWRLMPSGSVHEIRESAPVKSHVVSLTNLQPAQVYRIDIASESGGERAERTAIYLLTKPAEPVVIDNVDPGFSITGSWSTGTTAGGRYGADYRYCSTSPTGTNTANWTWQAPAAGDYAISLWWSQGSNRSTEAKYSVITGGVEYPLVFNQQANGGQWNLHGIYELAKGQSVTVRLYNTAPSGYVVIADAVQFKPAYTPLTSTALARFLEDGTAVSLPGATVTAVFDGEFYIQQASGVPGIKVIGGGVTEGDEVQVSGFLATIDGERAITNPKIR